MIFLATHIGLWLLIAFAFGLGIGWFMWGQWVGVDMNRTFARPSGNAGGESSSGSFKILSDSLLQTQRDLEKCQQSLAQAEAKLNASSNLSYPTAERESMADDLLSGLSDDYIHTQNGQRDDLKRIFGIGPVIENKLAELDITTYRQIAMLTAEDMEVVSEHINYFPGRIERDGWLESARMLHQEKYGEEL